jgi:Tol biopolymer transport system component/DNA-binding winged helix-turn-helix (wHTH) protein
MAQAVSTSRVIKFGVFEVDLHKGEVRKNGLKLRVRGQPFQVLSILLEHPGKIVTREEFQQRLWTNDETFVDFEHGLNAIVNRLREVLDDSPENPHFIETVPRRGYRWMVPIEGVEDRSIGTSPRHRHVWLSWAAVLVVIGLVGGIVKFILSASKAKTPGPALTSVPLTARPGYESAPSFSPDGNEVAWCGEHESESHIYVKLIGTDGPPLQLTTGPDGDYNPVWSPDGRFIAFLRNLPETAAILLIPALGGPAHKIAEIRLADIPGPVLAWAPNGNSLIISHKDSPKGPAALFVVAIDTGETRKLISPPSEAIGDGSGDSNPAFSPDGRTLAFIRTIDLRPELYLLRVSDAVQPVGEAKRIPLGLLRCFAPAWTEDGREIVISCEGQGLWRIGVSGSDTRSGQPARLPFGDNAQCPAISHRGHRLAYADGFGHSSIWRMAAPGGSSARDVPRARSFNRSFISSTRGDIFPHFSPDGRRIAFVSGRSGNMEIWVCNSDGSSPVQLTSFHGPVVTTPRWSPDGRRIAFDSDAEGGFDIWVIGADGGKPVRLTTHRANDGNPSWSHDGRWIYFDSNRTGEQQVWKMPADGGDAIQLTRDGAWAPLESPDGKFLYYTKNLGASREPGGTSVWKVPLGGGQAAKVLEGLSTSINLVILDKGIYFVPVPDAASGASIQFLDLQTNQIRRIASPERPIGMGDFEGLAISPDGRWLLYTQADQGGAELRLVENFR